MSGIVVASANGNVGIGASIEVLRAGGSAVDAVVAGIKLVEANPLDHSVGFSGLPNLLGEVELDASVMDGTGLRAGSRWRAARVPGCSRAGAHGHGHHAARAHRRRGRRPTHRKPGCHQSIC
ncbi:MAG: isoaspartyl peptidase/L-asparaginase [Thermomicrobiales bacterium]